MKVHLRQIQSDGLHLAGEEECLIPELTAEGIRYCGPLRYDLELGISEGALWATGSLVQPVEFQCVRCLEWFPFEIKVTAFSVHLELTGPEVVDLTPYFREDILLNLPPHPHCDREGGRVCKAAQTEKPEIEEIRKPDWSALDKLNLKR
jgi:uncharacterized metal-binding protein YceD (DUF177 family)